MTLMIQVILELSVGRQEKRRAVIAGLYCLDRTSSCWVLFPESHRDPFARASMGFVRCRGLVSSREGHDPVEDS